MLDEFTRREDLVPENVMMGLIELSRERISEGYVL
jgi:hypothetical protein